MWSSLLSSSRNYYGLRRRQQPGAPPPVDPEDDSQLLTITGRGFIQDIAYAVEERQHVLVVGPRGSGKTYCVRKGADLARKRRAINGWHLVFGNRETPKEQFSEDMPVYVNGEWVPLTALAISLADDRHIPKQRLEEYRRLCPTWPAIKDIDFDALTHLWDDPLSWTLTIVDEANRSSPGYQDNFLPLLDGGLISRGGMAYRVPSTVIMTANPAGYDTTAAQFGPAFVARFFQLIRLAQPPLDSLVHVVLRTQLTLNAQRRASVPTIPSRLLYVAAGITLLLWGNVDVERRPGCAYLTPGTKNLLNDAAKLLDPLAAAMKKLGDFSNFGPDARAVRDWAIAVRGRAIVDGRSLVTADDFASTAVRTLAHRVRETFHEGAEPQSMRTLQQQIQHIVRIGLSESGLENLFVVPYDEILKRVSPAIPPRGPMSDELDELLGEKPGVDAEQDLFEHFSLLPDSRASIWAKALANLPLPSELDKSSLDARRNEWQNGYNSQSASRRLYKPNGEFEVGAEKDWLQSLFDTSMSRMGARHMAPLYTIVNLRQDQRGGS